MRRKNVRRGPALYGWRVPGGGMVVVTYWLRRVVWAALVHGPGGRWPVDRVRLVCFDPGVKVVATDSLQSVRCMSGLGPLDAMRRVHGISVGRRQTCGGCRIADTGSVRGAHVCVGRVGLVGGKGRAANLEFWGHDGLPPVPTDSPRVNNSLATAGCTAGVLSFVDWFSAPHTAGPSSQASGPSGPRSDCWARPADSASGGRGATRRGGPGPF